MDRDKATCPHEHVVYAWEFGDDGEADRGAACHACGKSWKTHDDFERERKARVA
jgi:hypothetical protein